ncbi:MAG TPA: carboxymuconolactone decarboxylase family protein [Acidimicrobiales bacterium]|nr:carboxymuconolactone decarboxylase family protein [Acidimicrobiales bacterium]
MSAPGVPRIPPGDKADVGALNWLISTIAGRVGGTTTPNLFLTLGRHRRLFRGWLRFAGQMMPGGRLPRRVTELVILRVAHLRGCAYELDHHVRLGRRAGVTATDVDRVIAGPDVAGWTPREQAILRAVDALHRERDLDDATWADLRTHLDERAAIELVMLVGHYEMLATTIAALRIQTDEPRSRRPLTGERRPSPRSSELRRWLPPRPGRWLRRAGLQARHR